MSTIGFNVDLNVLGHIDVPRDGTSSSHSESRTTQEYGSDTVGSLLLSSPRSVDR